MDDQDCLAHLVSRVLGGGKTMVRVKNLGVDGVFFLFSDKLLKGLEKKMSFLVDVFLAFFVFFPSPWLSFIHS